MKLALVLLAALLAAACNKTNSLTAPDDCIWDKCESRWYCGPGAKKRCHQDSL